MLDHKLKRELVLTRTERRSLNETVYAKLKEAVIGGKLRPGDKLVEWELASSLGVSRSPIREAIYRLEHEGLALVKPRVGAFVTEITAHDVEESYDICGALEVLAVRLALKRLDSERSALLQQYVEQMVASARGDDKEGELEADSCFHSALIEFSDRRLLKMAFQVVLPTVQRSRTLHYLSFLSSSDQHDFAKEHVRLLEAINTGDESKATEAVTLHWKTMKQRIMQRLASKLPS